jgi:hypothetical protein
MTRAAWIVVLLSTPQCGEERGLRVDPECMASDCRERGACTYLPGEQRCVPGSDADCSQSQQCLRQARCGAENPGESNAYCRIRDSADCRRSDDCRDHGRCELIDRVCRAGSDEDCLQSWLCTRHGVCRMESRACTK